MNTPTLPPAASDLETLSAFESAIQRIGEDNARLAHMTAVFWGLDVEAALSPAPVYCPVSEAA